MIGDITLSFDNGPTRAVTPQVLDVLAAHGLRATFFVLGRHVGTPDAQALLARIADAGHWIGNHTFTHSVPLGETDAPDAPEAEIGRTQRLIEHVAHPDRLFRPFGGGGRLGPHLLSPSARAYLVRGGYSCVLWNAVPRDWEDPDGWVETALAQCRARPWSLLVLHDTDTGAMDHLDRFVRRARDEGARFRQDFPPECVVMQRGGERLPMAPYVAG